MICMCKYLWFDYNDNHEYNNECCVNFRLLKFVDGLYVGGLGTAIVIWDLYRKLLRVTLERLRLCVEFSIGAPVLHHIRCVCAPELIGLLHSLMTYRAESLARFIISSNAIAVYMITHDVCCINIIIYNLHWSGIELLLE